MLGRFQPWHEGHTALFERAISKTGQVVILLREQDGTDKNPFTFEQRKTQIIDELKKAGYEYNISYGRDVGYKIEQEHFDKDIEDISATKIREKLLDENSDTR